MFSPIHDHAGSNCWLRVLKGSMCETQYDYKEDIKPEPTGVQYYHPGQISYINGTSLFLSVLAQNLITLLFRYLGFT